ncbi:SAM-dependent methlyltransferase [Roseivivax halodurans JCM 10272]|uniref:SAM-dependent methlyltransferase n=1 Tax=Roseivivax halodurans JCM 10272 TaxID=1449350 RepID=X7EHN3_9RHOB|nr:RsmB/NOP family class I SAM-dependent RNA methyltransferase [Roseivivax halodurans]ETX14653.1 SAM-dependent methlyltransferase [Roseivivax halodurans JCM 10272]
MTPAARYATAAELCDLIASGEPAERALTRWARQARYAGSKDRAAVRDHVFDILRRWRSVAVAGGGETGRARVLGLLRLEGLDPEGIFTGEGHAPAPLSEVERAAGRSPEGRETWEMPGWLCDRVASAYGAEAEAITHALRHRAPVTLRVNALKTGVVAAQAALAAEGIETAPNPLAPMALTVTGNARRVAASRAYLEGLVELQDAASQTVVELLPLEPGMAALDLCAGGGGKTLGLAARLGGGPVDAHDADAGRMSNLPMRAGRAGAEIRIRTEPEGEYDIVLADVPCSGSGAWRRAPEGKWRLTESGLDDLLTTQDGILNHAASLVAPGGTLAYATCSILPEENAERVSAFLHRAPGWSVVLERQFLPDAQGDGFYTAQLRRER